MDQLYKWHGDSLPRIPTDQQRTRPTEGLFRSLFMAGFECSSHRRVDGRRLDLVAATAHDRLVQNDYRSVLDLGLGCARDGLRWHLIESEPGRYDWSSLMPMLKAARELGLQVVWDLCHYGVPDHIDIWSDDFVTAFARFATAAVLVIAEETDGAPFVCPINEISFWAWAGSDGARFAPAEPGRGDELKRQLARAAIVALDAIRAAVPRTRWLMAEPLIHVAPGSALPEDIAAAAAYREAQFTALDLVSGGCASHLGGRPDLLDVVGVNVYPDNQWIHGGSTIPLGHHGFRPLRHLLAEVHARYGRPIIVSETGAEGTARASWLHYICSEVRAARSEGVPVEAICLYPVLDYPGWDNDRSCEVGLLSMPDWTGLRTVDPSLAEEVRRQQSLFALPMRLSIEAVQQRGARR